MLVRTCSRGGAPTPSCLQRLLREIPKCRAVGSQAVWLTCPRHGSIPAIAPEAAAVVGAGPVISPRRSSPMPPTPFGGMKGSRVGLNLPVHWGSKDHIEEFREVKYPCRGSI